MTTAQTSQTTMATLTVTDAFGVCFQDFGRIGFERYGIARNGAADLFSYRAANILVGNPAGAPVFEAIGNGFEFQLDGDAVFSVTGAEATVTVDGCGLVPQWQPIRVPAGSRVAISAPQRGYRTYVALRGDLEVPRMFGSVSEISFWGQTSFATPGMAVPIRPADEPFHPERADGDLLASLGDVAQNWLLEAAPALLVVPGPQERMFDHIEHLYTEQYRMNAHSDSIGSRFNGRTPERIDRTEIMSRSIPIGSLEIPEDGEVIGLLRGRSITAGYPVPGIVAAAEINRLAQIAPGADVRFARVDLGEARAAVMAAEARLAAFTEAVQPCTR